MKFTKINTMYKANFKGLEIGEYFVWSGAADNLCLKVSNRCYFYVDPGLLVSVLLDEEYGDMDDILTDLDITESTHAVSDSIHKVKLEVEEIKWKLE